MTTLEGFTLFTTGVRVSVLIMLIVVLWNTIRVKSNSVEDLYYKIAHNPKAILTLASTLLLITIIEASIELYDHIFTP